MLLHDKVAVIYGGGGTLGSSMARTFAREGAVVVLAGRSPGQLELIADQISAAGGRATIAVVDALDEAAVAAHAEELESTHGGIDLSINAIGIDHVQGVPLAELTLDDFLHPITSHLRSTFITTKAASRLMARRGSGGILTISTLGSILPGPGHLGYGVTCGAIETYSRILSGELAASGIRVVCVRSHAIPESVATSYVGEVFTNVARNAGTDLPGWFETLSQQTLLGRLPTLAEFAEPAAFVASDRAGAMTGAIVNLTCGALVD